MFALYQSFSRAAPDEVSERVDSAGDIQEDELTYLRSSLFEDLHSDEDEPDPRVQEVGSRNDVISNSTEICDFLKLVELCLKIQ